VGDKLVKLVSVRDGEEFKRIRVEKVSRVTVNKELRTLRAAFNLASELGYAEFNPFKSVRQLRVPNVEPKHLSAQEFKKLLSTIEESDFRILVEFTVLTMLRRSELINLMWEDVDTARQVIHIGNKTDFTVKGMKARVVPLNDRATQILNVKSQRGCYVFAGPDGSRRNGGSLSRKFKKYVRKCGLPDELHFHSLRHTGASWLVQQGVPLFAVQKILGHSSPNVTQIYSHLEDMHLHDAVSKLSVGNSPASSSIHPVLHLN
jgi:integrase